MCVFSTLFIISLLPIDICYSSIIAKSSLVDVVQLSGGDGVGRSSLAAFDSPLLTIVLTPHYVISLDSFYYHPDAY